MKTRRIALALGAGLLALATAGAGVYAAAQNTNQAPPPFRGGRMGGPGGPGRGGPGGPMGMLPMLARELNITDAQRDQIRNIAQSHSAEWKALGDRARTAHKALDDAITASTVDEGLIRQRSAELAAVDADLAVARAKAHAEVFQILTPEQKAKAQELRTQMEQRMNNRAERRQGRF